MAPPVRKDGADRSDRLQSYTAKDYTEVVEFPVELVDRDGVVRRYSYEESLAVYHRRIQSAAWRYADEELVRAEIGHCTRRIDQIKRSYMLRAESGGPATAPDPRASLGEGWEILQRFYRKSLERRRLPAHDELPLVVSLVHDEPLQRIYHVATSAQGSGHLLYVFPFAPTADGERGAAFREAEARYALQPISEDVERLLHRVEGRDAGYLLCGQRELLEGLEQGAREQVPAQTHDGEPESPMDARSAGRAEWLAGMEALGRGAQDEAVDHLRESIQRNPFHRDAYVALLSILDGRDQWSEADFWAALAARHLPDDPFLRFRTGVQLARRGEFDAAVATCDEAAQLEPLTHHPLLFAAHVQLARGRDLSGSWRRLQEAIRRAPEDTAVQRTWRMARIALRVRAGGLVVAAVFGIVAAITASFGDGWGLHAAVPWATATLALLSATIAGAGTSLVASRWVRRESSDEKG